MRTYRWFRSTGILFAALALAPLALPPVLAHPRPVPHKHRAKPRFERKAVVVVGKDRPVKHEVVITGVPHGTLDLNVKPKSTEVWVNGAFRGTCDDYDGTPGKLHLLPGVHTLKLVRPDGLTAERDVRIKARMERSVSIDLR